MRDVFFFSFFFFFFFFLFFCCCFFFFFFLFFFFVFLFVLLFFCCYCCCCCCSFMSISSNIQNRLMNEYWYKYWRSFHTQHWWQYRCVYQSRAKHYWTVISPLTRIYPVPLQLNSTHWQRGCTKSDRVFTVHIWPKDFFSLGAAHLYDECCGPDQPHCQYTQADVHRLHVAQGKVLTRAVDSIYRILGYFRTISVYRKGPGFYDWFGSLLFI